MRPFHSETGAEYNRFFVLPLHFFVVLRDHPPLAGLSCRNETPLASLDLAGMQMQSYATAHEPIVWHTSLSSA